MGRAQVAKWSIIKSVLRRGQFSTKYLGIGESLRVWNILLPCIGQRTKCTPEHIHVHMLWWALWYTWSSYKIHLANQINRAGNILLTDSHEIIIFIPFWVKDRQRSKTIVQWYSIPKEKFYNQIQQNFVDFNQLSYTELIIKLMNSQNFSVNSHLLKFVSLCNDLRNNLLSNHADDTWLTIVIIALHYHCYDLFFFFFMLKFLQYCNYIIKDMQIKLMLLLLLAM